MKKELISTNPAQGYKEVGRVTISSQVDVQNAVKNARKALPAWRALSVKERGEYFQKFLDLYKEHVKELAELQTKEMGKPIIESLGECNSREVMIELNIEHSIRVLQPQVLDTYDTYQTEMHFEPRGVVAAIAPWNYPTSQFLIAIAQPLLAGNTIVFKHSEECPLTSKFLTELMHKAGFPEGVFTCLYGDGVIGKMLLDQNVDLISFTGSSRVGEMIYKKAAEKFIPAILEMGGSSPAIIFDDVNLDETCLSIFTERFRNNEQICCALKRLVVHQSIHDEAIKTLVNIIKNHNS